MVPFCRGQKGHLYPEVIRRRCAAELGRVIGDDSCPKPTGGNAGMFVLQQAIVRKRVVA